MKKLSLPQCRVLREMMEVADADGEIDTKVWQYANDLPQKAALLARGAVSGPAGGPFRIHLKHRSMLSVWPDKVGIAYLSKLGWRGVIEVTPDDPTYFGVLVEGSERIAVTRETVVKYVAWFASPNKGSH